MKLKWCPFNNFWTGSSTKVGYIENKAELVTWLWKIIAGKQDVISILIKILPVLELLIYKVFSDIIELR